MVVSAQRDKIVVVKPFVIVCRYRRDMVYFKPAAAYHPCRIAYAAAVVVALKYRRRLALPRLSVSEFIRCVGFLPFAAEHSLAAPLVYLVTYIAVMFHKITIFV